LPWVRLCHALGREDLGPDPRFATVAARAAQRASLVSLLQGIFEQAPLIRWLERLEKAGVPCAPINTLADVFYERSGRGGPLVFVVTETRYTDAAGELVRTERWTVVRR
jgi:crotonobetainyl-CoA:carnitine CoA-transferase CaiB-like acyl-CoA transferase